MTAEDIEGSIERAIVFFERARQVADTDNFDYAIDMYIEGLRRAPDTLEEGHIALRKIALIRQGKGGKKPSIKARMKLNSGKTPLDKMLNTETLLAKDPDNLQYAEALLSSAVAGGYTRTAEWIAQLVFDANLASEKPSLAAYILLKDSYTELRLFAKAVKACKCAIDIKPDDEFLRQELRDLSARMTMQNGKYEQEGNFTKSIKDRNKQHEMYSKQRLIKTVDIQKKTLQEAKQAVLEDPKSPVNILKLAQILFDNGTKDGFKQAVKILRDAYSRSDNFSFRRREGELVIKRLTLQVRQLQVDIKDDPENSTLKNDLVLTQNKLSKAQTQHFKACVDHYPTDTGMKYEYAICLIKDQQFDEAIPLLQLAQRDPRRKLAAMDETGLCFFLKGWYADAIDIFNKAIDLCEVKDSDVAKDLRYNLARSFEEDGQTEKAYEIYRKLAQLDFGYKDVKQRVDRLRNAGK